MMQPTWKSDCGTVKLWLGDCLDVMRTWPDGAVDAVVTDPPYGIGDKPRRPRDGERLKRGRTRNTWFPDSEWDMSIRPEWCRECSRWPCGWFGNWRKRDIVEAAFSTKLRCEIIWAKDTHVGPPIPAAMQDERLWWFAPDQLKTTRFETTVWHEPIIPTWGKRRHRNEKPERLMARAVSWVEAATVADPFMGSGTTGVAAVRLGRQFWGVEIDPDYFEIAKRRIEDELRKADFLEPERREHVQASLFDNAKIHGS